MKEQELVLKGCNITISEGGSCAIKPKKGEKPPLLQKEDIQKINDFIKKNSKVESLSIGFNISSKEEVDQIFGILEQNTHLTGLSIGNVKRSISSYFGNKLKENQTLTSITGNECGLWDEITSKEIIGAISYNPRIIKLIIASLSESTFRYVADLLVETTTLKGLNIRTQLFEQDFQKLGLLAAFSENTSLTKLNTNIRGAGEALMMKDGDHRDPKGNAKEALKANKYWKEPIEIDTGYNAVKFNDEDKKTIAANVAQNKVRIEAEESKAYNKGLQEFVGSIFQDDKVSTKSKIKIDATKDKLSKLLCNKLQGIIDTAGENSEYLKELLKADKETQKKMSHSIIDGLSCLKIEGAKFKYQSIRKTTDILTKIVEFCCGVIMYPKDGGKALNKCLKNHTELMITDHTKFADSISDIIHPNETSTKEFKAKSIDDVLDGVFKEGMAAKVKRQERGGGVQK